MTSNETREQDARQARAERLARIADAVENHGRLRCWHFTGYATVHTVWGLWHTVAVNERIYTDSQTRAEKGLKTRVSQVNGGNVVSANYTWEIHTC